MSNHGTVSPDCRDGKHLACIGDSWDEELDQACACSCACHSAPTGTITGAQAADWLIRSALPAFCDLANLDEDAAWFRQLEPYQGHTPSGRIKGWQGAGRRVLAVEEQINEAYGNLHRVVREAGRALYSRDSEIVASDAHAEVTRAAIFGRKVLLPSRVGRDAYRVLSTISDLTAHSGYYYEVAGYVEAVNQAWDEAWAAIADRSRLNELEGAPMGGDKPHVDPAVFAAALKKHDKALARYADASDKRDAATRDLNALECRATFRVIEGTLPDDPAEWADSDYCEYDDECTLPASHAGEHSGGIDQSETAPPAYREAISRWREVNNVTAVVRERWEDAEMELEELRCNHRRPDVWPCGLRRGHDGLHEHPREMRLIW